MQMSAVARLGWAVAACALIWGLAAWAVLP
jgi:hypothetical protein